MNELQYILLGDGIDLSQLDFKDDEGNDSEGLQEFIQKHAHSHHKGNFGLTYVLNLNDENIGYVTLATSAIEKKSFARAKRPYAPATPYLPSIIIANFAIDRRFRGCRIGSRVLLWIFGLARQIGKDVGCRYITLYAKNAISFYEKNGYRKTDKANNEGFVLMYKDLYPDKS